MNSIVYAKEWMETIVEWKCNTNKAVQGGTYGIMTLAKSSDGKMVDFVIATYTFDFKLDFKLGNTDFCADFLRFKSFAAFKKYGLIDEISWKDSNDFLAIS